MKLSIHILFFACSAAAACLGASAASENEPIPDFGPEGPAGYEKQGSVAENLSVSSLKTTNRGLVFVRTALRELNLDGKQQKAVKKALEQYSEQGATLRSDVNLVRDTIRAARVGEGNESVVKNAQQAMRELSQKGRTLQAQLSSSISNILTEEQFQKFNQIQEARRKQVARRAKTL